MSEVKRYWYEVRYLDSREGNLRIASVHAVDDSSAYEEAYDADYYFGSLVSIERLHEVGNDE